jgi:hypothetical protein
MTTSHKRTPLPLQLSPGIDDDLIQWLANIEKGDRNRVVKAIIRRGLGLPPVDYELSALRRDIERTGDPELLERLTALEAYTYDQLTQAANHINELYQRLDTIASASGSDAITPNAPEVEISRASDEQLEKRSKKLKGSSW